MSKKLLYTALTVGLLNIMGNNAVISAADEQAPPPLDCLGMTNACIEDGCKAFSKNGGDAGNKAFEYCKVLSATTARVLTLEGENDTKKISPLVALNCKETCNEVLNGNCQSGKECPK